jgi:hypothetical protein
LPHPPSLLLSLKTTGASLAQLRNRVALIFSFVLLPQVGLKMERAAPRVTLRSVFVGRLGRKLRRLLSDCHRRGVIFVAQFPRKKELGYDFPKSARQRKVTNPKLPFAATSEICDENGLFRVLHSVHRGVESS